MASCTGNVSIKGEKIFVHAHLVLSNNNGKTTAGHLLEGRVFAAEVHLVELLCENVLRKYDQETGPLPFGYDWVKKKQGLAFKAYLRLKLFFEIQLVNLADLTASEFLNSQIIHCYRQLFPVLGSCRQWLLSKYYYKLVIDKQSLGRQSLRSLLFTKIIGE